MAPDLNNAASPTDREKQKNLDQEVREMISTLTSRLGSIQRSQKSGSSSSHAQADDDEQGMRMITLAGTNLGATMRGDLDDKATAPQGLSLPEQEETASYVVNSNFQAINNSIMLGGSYKTNDPGVHLDITDYVDHNDGDKKGKKSRRGGHGGGHHHGKRSDNLSDTESEKN